MLGPEYSKLKKKILLTVENKVPDELEEVHQKNLKSWVSLEFTL